MLPHLAYFKAFYSVVCIYHRLTNGINHKDSGDHLIYVFLPAVFCLVDKMPCAMKREYTGVFALFSETGFHVSHACLYHLFC